MIFEKKDYIVKAKDINIEIEHSIINKYKSFKKFIYAEILGFILALIYIIISHNISVIMVLGFLVMATVIIIFEKNWSIKIKNRKIYIKNHSGNHKIKYENLICFRKCYRIIKHSREKIIEVKYLKGKKIVHIILPYADEFEYELEQMCNTFITKGDIENGVYIDNQYFDIRDENQNNYIEKKSRFKIDKHIFYIMVLVGNLIVYIILVIELLKKVIK